MRECNIDRYRALDDGFAAGECGPRRNSFCFAARYMDPPLVFCTASHGDCVLARAHAMDRGESGQCARYGDGDSKRGIFAAAAGRAPREREPSLQPLPRNMSGRGWWCFGPTDPVYAEQFGLCYRTHGECRQQRADVERRDTSGTKSRKCEPRHGAAACFTYRAVLGNFSVATCHDSVRACVEQREYILTKTLEYDSVSDCGAYE